MSATYVDNGNGTGTITASAGSNSTLLITVSGATMTLALTGETWTNNGSASLNVATSQVASGLSVDLNDGTNVLNVRNTAGPLTFAPSGGTNTLNISSNAPSNTGNLATINGNVSIVPTSGTVSVWISDGLGTTGNSPVTIGDSSLTGLMGPSDEYSLSWDFSGGGSMGTFRVTGSAVGALVEAYQINATPGTTFRLDPQNGVNTVNVRVLTTPWTLNGGSGVDTYIFGTAAGSAAGLDGVTAAPSAALAAAAGSNSIRFDDTGSESGNKIYTITPGASAGAQQSLACPSFTTMAFGATGTYAGGLRFDGSSIGGNTFVVAADFQDNATIAANGSGNTLNLAALAAGWTDNGSGTITQSNGKTITYSGFATVTPTNTLPPSTTPTSGTVSTEFECDSGTWTGDPDEWSWESSPEGEDDWTEFSTEEEPTVLGSEFGVGVWDTRLTATNAGGPSDPVAGDTLTVSAASVAGRSGTGVSVGVGL